MLAYGNWILQFKELNRVLCKMKKVLKLSNCDFLRLQKKLKDDKKTPIFARESRTWYFSIQTGREAFWTKRPRDKHFNVIDRNKKEGIFTIEYVGRN